MTMLNGACTANFRGPAGPNSMSSHDSLINCIGCYIDHASTLVLKFGLIGAGNFKVHRGIDRGLT